MLLDRRFSVTVAAVAVALAVLCLSAVHVDATVFSYDTSVPIHVAIPGDYTNALDNNPTYRALEFADNESYSGMVAAFHEANTNGGIYGRNISATKFLTYGAHSSYTAEFNTNMEAMFKPYGPDKINFTMVAGSGITIAKKAMTLSKTVKRLPVIGAESLDPEDFEAGQTQALHLRASMQSEAFHLLGFATQRLYCRRFLIFFMPSFGMPSVAALMEQAIAKMNLPTPTMQMTVLVRNTTHHQAWKDQLLPTLDAMEEPPHGVFLFMDGETARHIVEVYSKSSRFKQGDMYFFMGSFGAVLNYTDSEGKSDVFKNLFFSTSYPFADDDRYKIVQEYHDAIVKAKQDNAIDVVTSDVWNSYALDGYVVGRAIVTTLKHMNPANITPEGFIDAFFDSKMMAIADLVYGPYSRSCVGAQTNTTGQCWCNTGTKMQHIITVDPATGLAIGVRDNATLHEEAIAELNIALVDCSVTEAYLVEPFIITSTYDEPEAVMAADSTSPFFSEATYAQAVADGGAGGQVNMETLQENVHTETSAAQFHFVNSVNKEFAGERASQRLSNSVLFATRQFVPNATLTTLREREKSRYKILAAMFLLTNDVAMAQHEHLSFAPLHPGLQFQDRDSDTLPFAQHDKYMIHVFPSLADFAHTAASYAASTGLASKVIVVADTAALLSLAQRSVETFGSPMLHGRVVSAYSYTAGSSSDSAPASFTAASMASLTQQIEAAVSTGVDVMSSSSAQAVVIVLTHDVVVVNAALQAARTTAGAKATFVVCASELRVAEAVRYASDGSGRTSTSAPASTLSAIPSRNVLFASGLPPGAGLSPDIFAAYGEVVGRAITAGFEVPADRTGAGMAKAVMQLGSLSHKSVTMEPLSAVDCGLTAPVYPHPGGTCQCTKGLNQMQLYNVTDASIAAGQLAMNFDRATHQLKYAQCGISYIALPTTPALWNVEIALIGASGFIAVFMLVFFVLFCILRPKGRDVSNAPKESSKPFAVVFTDIQASTAMWALAPEHMGAGLDVHHHTIRDLIHQYDGYEVKTIGDSFMVAFKDVNDASRFAVATQRALYSAAWETVVFDRTYDEILNERFPELDKTIRAGGNEKLWQGIRVRVGVHYGHGTVVFDETTQAYDYYGTVVNTAARVEGVSHGGQVVLTQAAYDALTPGAIELDGEVVVKNLGPQPLRGLPEDITLVQVLPEQFAMREFPPLRLDVEIVLEEPDDDSDDVEESTEAASSAPASRGHSSNGVRAGTPLKDKERLTAAAAGSQPSETSSKPTTAQGVAKRLLAKGGNKAPLEVLLLVDRAMATLMAPDTQSNRVSAMKRWADKWRLPKLHRRDMRHLSQVPHEEVARVRLALRVVESMAATGHISGGAQTNAPGEDMTMTSILGASMGRSESAQGLFTVHRTSGQAAAFGPGGRPVSRDSRPLSSFDPQAIAAMNANASSTSRDGFTIPGRPGSPVELRISPALRPAVPGAVTVSPLKSDAPKSRSTPPSFPTEPPQKDSLKLSSKDSLQRSAGSASGNGGHVHEDGEPRFSIGSGSDAVVAPPDGVSPLVQVGSDGATPKQRGLNYLAEPRTASPAPQLPPVATNDSFTELQQYAKELEAAIEKKK